MKLWIWMGFLLLGCGENRDLHQEAVNEFDQLVQQLNSQRAELKEGGVDLTNTGEYTQQSGFDQPLSVYEKNLTILRDYQETYQKILDLVSKRQDLSIGNKDKLEGRAERSKKILAITTFEVEDIKETINLYLPLIKEKMRPTLINLSNTEGASLPVQTDGADLGVIARELSDISKGILQDFKNQDGVKLIKDEKGKITDRAFLTVAKKPLRPKAHGRLYQLVNFFHKAPQDPLAADFLVIHSQQSYQKEIEIIEVASQEEFIFVDAITYTDIKLRTELAQKRLKLMEKLCNRYLSQKKSLHERPKNNILALFTSSSENSELEKKCEAFEKRKKKDEVIIRDGKEMLEMVDIF